MSATEILHARDFPPCPRLRKRLFSQLLWSPGREPGRQTSQPALHQIIQQAFDNLKSSVPSPGWAELSKPRDRKAGNAPDRKISVAGRRPQDQGGLKCTQWSSKEFPSHCVKRAGGKGGRGPGPSPYLDCILIRIGSVTWKITLHGTLKPQYQQLCKIIRGE